MRTICHGQLQSGKQHHQLKPLISIWLLNAILYMEKVWRYCFEVLDEETKRRLIDHLQLYVFQLPNVGPELKINKRLLMWLRFFKEGSTLDADHPPPWIREDEVMAEALGELKQFSDREADCHLYRQRRNYQLLANIDKRLMEEAIRDKEQAEQALMQVEQEKAQMKKQAEQEKARLLATLSEKEAELGRALEALKQKGNKRSSQD